MEKQFETIILTIEDGICTIFLNRPQAMNALCDDLNRDLYAALKIVQDDRTARVLIITGKGKAFAAGADITEMLEANQFGAERKARDGHIINDFIESLPIPVIAAVNGAAMGGGLEIALACDFIVADEKALFAFPEVGLGIVPGAGGSQRLTKLIGAANAKKLILLGQMVKGPEALEMGLVTSIAAPGEALKEGLNIAKKLCEKPAAALWYGKLAVNFAVDHDRHTGNEYEKTLFSLCFETQDQKEGMSSFLEKRAANYTHTRKG